MKAKIDELKLRVETLSADVRKALESADTTKIGHVADELDRIAKDLGELGTKSPTHEDGRPWVDGDDKDKPGKVEPIPALASDDSAASPALHPTTSGPDDGGKPKSDDKKHAKA